MPTCRLALLGHDYGSSFTKYGFTSPRRTAAWQAYVLIAGAPASARAPTYLAAKQKHRVLGEEIRHRGGATRIA